MNKTLYSWIINSYKSLPYLKLAIQSIRDNAYYKKQPILVYTENDIETYDWIKSQSDITAFYEENAISRGIGGGVNFLVEKCQTEYINLIHSDMVISKHYDKPLYEIVSEKDSPIVACAWRCEPNIWNQSSRLGTIMSPADTIDGFGSYYYDFQTKSFLTWADEFVNSMEYPSFRKVEGVSYMMRKKYFINNDSRFAPTSFEDHMQSVLMQLNDYNFIVTNKAMVWHFGARSSHFLGQQDKLVGTSNRQKECEAKNMKKWVELWGEHPSFDEFGFIRVTEQMKRRFDQNKENYYG
jgi:hypothetical protein